MKPVAVLAVFLFAVLGIGSAIGSMTQPGEWYEQLVKPSFNPPNWVFGPVWTALYIMIAVAGYRTWMRERSGQAMKLWFAQMFLNFLWSPVFFGAHSIGGAFAVIVLLLGAIFAFIRRAWNEDRTAAWLFIPYALWVSFAAVLNASLWRLNAALNI